MRIISHFQDFLNWVFFVKIMQNKANYRPQTKLWEGNVFTPVCDSVHGGVYPSMHWTGVHRIGRQPPPRADPPLGRDLLADTPLDRPPPDGH